MKCYKCSQCNLTNWTTDEFCKRCQSPNPYFNQNFQDNKSNSVTAQNFAATGNYGQNYEPDYSSPPPPNVFGSAVGENSANEGYNYQSNNYANRPPMRGAANNFRSPETANKLAEAEKQIRNAWISGVIVCVITTIVALVVSRMSGENTIVPASPMEMMLSVFILGGLTLGVYFKNRGCAIALCVLFILDKIATFAATGKFSGAILTFVFIYYFAYGIQGTFTYHKLKKQGFTF